VADDNDERRARAALINTSAPNHARVGDYLYGGRNNFEADRKIAQAMMAVAPVVSALGPTMRAFRHRVVRHLVTEAGVRQFLDIGTGLEATGNTHGVAQSLDPRCRVVYVDSDPVVLAHARALMRSSAEGVTRCVDSDVFDSGAILAGARDFLDFSRPVAIMLMATLTFTPDTAAAATLVSALLAAAVPGSYVAIYHQASDLHPALLIAARRWNQQAARMVTLRSAAEVASLVAGLDMVPPGLVPICEWRPEPGDPSFEDVVPVYGVVARRPLRRAGPRPLELQAKKHLPWDSFTPVPGHLAGQSRRPSEARWCQPRGGRAPARTILRGKQRQGYVSGIYTFIRILGACRNGPLP
jgi:hypothetical protein